MKKTSRENMTRMPLRMQHFQDIFFQFHEYYSHFPTLLLRIHDVFSDLDLPKVKRALSSIPPLTDIPTFLCWQNVSHLSLSPSIYLSLYFTLYLSLFYFFLLFFFLFLYLTLSHSRSRLPFLVLFPRISALITALCVTPRIGSSSAHQMKSISMFQKGK